jgi:D-glycero-D-manno-heptose 1,7-bisphosphate phosphatase
MSIKTIFLDRDGVINKEANYLYKIQDFEFISGVFDSCQYLQDIGYKIIIITNQSGISRGFYTEKDFLTLNDWMVKEFYKKGVEILDVFYCPHSPADNCNCRKPKPGMLIKAKEKYDLNLKESWVIGDKENDIKAANNAGVNNTILVRSGHIINEMDSLATHIIDSIKEIHNKIKK